MDFFQNGIKDYYFIKLLFYYYICQNKIKMKTTVLSDDMHRQVSIVATYRGKSITEVIDECMRVGLEEIDDE